MGTSYPNIIKIIFKVYSTFIYFFFHLGLVHIKSVTQIHQKQTNWSFKNSAMK